MIAFPRLLALSLLLGLPTLTLSCESRKFNSEEASDTQDSKSSKASQPPTLPILGAALKGSPAFSEMESFYADPDNQWKFTQMTPCDLFVWAESSWPTLPLDPRELAKSLKSSTVSLGSPISFFEQLDPPRAGVPVKGPLPLDEAIKVINGYLRFTDPDPSLKEFVHTSWIQAIHKHAWVGSKGYVGTRIEKKAGELFSAESLLECQSYVKNIQADGVTTTEHLVGDYLAHVYAQDFLARNSKAEFGVLNQEWTEVLLSSDLVKKVPYLALVSANPAPVGMDPNKLPTSFDPQKDARRHAVPTVSHRTLKAMWGDLALHKVKQELSLKALCYFKTNRQKDYRNRNIPSSWSVGILKTESNWIGNWSLETARAFRNLEDVEQDLEPYSCEGVDFLKPF